MEIKIGIEVKHKKHGFVGVVQGIRHNREIVVRITEGKHPFNSQNKYYTAWAENLEVIVDTDDTFDVEMKLPDGTEIKFDNVGDLITFMEAMKK